MRPDRAALVTLLVLAITGCQKATDWRGDTPIPLTVTNLQTNSAVNTGFEQAWYRLDSGSSATFLLLQGTADDPSRAAVIRMLWLPIGGVTPISDNATNCTVSYFVFNEDGVDVWTGAGFAYPNNPPGPEQVTLSLWQMDLQPEPVETEAGQDTAPNLNRVEGRVTATRDDVLVDNEMDRLQQTLSRRLGRPRLVTAD